MKTTIPRMASVDTLCKLAREGNAGRYWYDEAQGEIDRAASLLGSSPRELADYLSLFSPRTSVKRSIKVAFRYMESRTLPSDVIRSVRTAVCHYEQTGEIRGPKTGAFARALCGERDAVVLDTWMAKAFRINQKHFSRPAVYAKCCGRVRAAAKKLGWNPCEVQAAVWRAAVKRAGRKPGSISLVVDTLFGTFLKESAASYIRNRS